MKEENQEKKDIKKNKIGAVILFFTAIFVLFLIFSTIFALLNMGNSNIISGIHIHGIDVSGLSKEEAIELLQNRLQEKIDGSITLEYEEYKTQITPNQFEAYFPIEEAVNQALAIGRTGNILTNNYTILGVLIGKKDTPCMVEYKEDILDKMLEDISIKLPGAMVESSYYTEENNLIITKGKTGVRANKEKLKEAIIQSINNLEEKAYLLKIPVQEESPQEIDIETIHDEIYKQPINAYIVEEPLEVHPHVEGIDFAISLEEAKELLKTEQEEYVIPLTTITPEVTTNDLGERAFPEVLGSFMTKYDPGNENRSTNLKLAAEKINGTVLLPGETFSYNKVVGERTIEAGYKEAAIYQGGEVVDGLGGGICQLSTTLYNAVLYANLEIVSRTNHHFLTSYADPGRDATVAYGSIDFQFKNSRKYPAKIICDVEDGIANIEIRGIKEEQEYEVVIQTKVDSSIPFTTKYIEDPTLPAGTEEVKQVGMNGCTSEAYRILKKNGAVVSKELLSKDTYNAMTRIVRKGTK